jgi:hypothetical protein
MIRYILAVIAAATVTATAAIDIATPEVKPAVVYDKARLTEFRVGFYRGDGKHMLSYTDTAGTVVSCADTYIEYQVGTGDGEQFTAAETRFIRLDAQQMAALLAASITATPAEPLVPQLGITPMDKLFQAIVDYLKAQGKL